MAKVYFEKLTNLVQELKLEDEVGSPIEVRHFFSGAAVYFDNVMCASWSPVGLAFKLSEPEVQTLIDSGEAIPLKYFPNGHIKKGYALFENPEGKPSNNWKRFFIKAALHSNVTDREFRRNWRKNWLDSIRELSDIEYQYATWLNPPDPSPHYTFVEFLASYYDSIVYATYDKLIQDGLVSEVEAEIVSEFHKRLGQYKPPTTSGFVEPLILEDPEWHQVVQAGAEAYDKLKALNDME